MEHANGFNGSGSVRDGTVQSISACSSRHILMLDVAYYGQYNIFVKLLGGGEFKPPNPRQLWACKPQIDTIVYTVR